MFIMSSPNPGPEDILGCVIVCCRACPVHCGMSSLISDLCPIVTVKNVPRCCQTSAGGQIHHWVRRNRWRCVTCACCSIPGFNGSEDCAALEQLLEGYDQQDQDQVSEVCNSPLFKYMDNDVSGLLLIFLLSSWMEEASNEIISLVDLWTIFLLPFFTWYFSKGNLAFAMKIFFIGLDCLNVSHVGSQPVIYPSTCVDRMCIF